MHPSRLQERISHGLARAARRLGAEYQLYRPDGARNPLSSSNRLLSLPASFNAQDPAYKQPNGYGKALWFGVFDTSVTRPGDYLAGPEGVFFIAAQQPLLPVLCVQTNRTLGAARPARTSGAGASSYGGVTPSSVTALLANWPASVMADRSGETGILPSDASIPFWSVLLPRLPVLLRGADLLNDDIGRNFVVASAEQTALGWRIGAKQAST